MSWDFVFIFPKGLVAGGERGGGTSILDLKVQLQQC